MAFRDQIQKKLDAKRAEIADLESKLSSARAYAQAIEDMLRIAPKESSPEETSSMVLRPGTALALTQAAILRAGKPLHISEILASLNKTDTKPNRISLGGSLANYARQDKIFTKPGPNTFGLIGMENKQTQGEQNSHLVLKVA